MLLCDLDIVDQALHSRILLAHIQLGQKDPHPDLHFHSHRDLLEHCNRKASMPVSPKQLSNR
jgi:hypothetical protein